MPDASEFNERLARFAGRTPDGESRLRAIWGPEGRFWDGKPRYICGWKQVVSYYVACNVKTGEEKFFRRREDVGKLGPDWLLGIGGLELEPILDERWYIEWWVSPARVAQSPVEGSDVKGLQDWERTLGEFPRKGLWMTVTRITWADGGYRPLDEAVFAACLDFLDNLKKYDAFGETGINAKRICDETVAFIRRQREEQDKLYDEALRLSLSEGRMAVTPKAFIPEEVK